MSKPSDIASAIRAKRRALGLRQDQLAAAAGVGVRFVVELEAGKPSAHLGKVLEVLDALGLDLSLRDQ